MLKATDKVAAALTVEVLLKITIITLFMLNLFNCTAHKNTTGMRRPFWRDNSDTVIQLEQTRLSAEPLEKNESYNGKYKIITYDDKFLSALCRLSYYFENDKLSFIIYSSSDPDWDKRELNYRIQTKLDDLYGNSSKIKIKNKTYYHWTASDAHIYYYFKRIPQDKIFWRTFIAHIIYSYKPVEESPFLKDILANSRY